MDASSKRHRLDLPAAFHRPGDRATFDVEAAPLLAAHADAPTLATRDALIAHCLPLVTAQMFTLIGGSGARLGVDPDDVIGIAALALVGAVNAYDREPCPAHFRHYVIKAAYNAVWDVRGGWSFVAAAKRAASRTNGRRFRRTFLLEHGRYPTRDESRCFLRSIITNPALQVGDVPDVLSASQHGVDGELADVAAVPVDLAAPLLSRETLRLASRGLNADARAILRLILRHEGGGQGDAMRAVAARFKLDRKQAHRRILGVLWELRTRADLAEHLECEPADPAARPAYVALPHQWLGGRAGAPRKAGDTIGGDVRRVG